MISKQLIAAYKETHFIINDFDKPILIDEAFIFTPIEEYSRCSIESIAFITAWNPYSEMLSLEKNTERNKKLLSEVESIGCYALKGIGINPNSDWPGEESYAIININKNKAIELAKSFEQNAFVWAQKNKKSKLIFIDYKPDGINYNQYFEKKQQ